MGTNTLANRATAQTVEAADVNQFVTALVGDLVPRSAGLGPVASAGSIGSVTYPWQNAYFSNQVSISSSINDYAMKVVNGRTDATGFGLLVQTYYNTAANTVLRVTSNGGATDFLNIKGDGAVNFTNSSVSITIAASGNGLRLYNTAGGVNPYISLLFDHVSDHAYSEIRSYRDDASNNYRTHLSFRTNQTGSTGSNEWMTLDYLGQLKLIATTVSSSYATGALIVSGGVGVAGNITTFGAFQVQQNGGSFNLANASLTTVSNGYTLYLPYDNGASQYVYKIMSNFSARGFTISHSDSKAYGTAVASHAYTDVMNMDSSGITSFSKNIASTSTVTGTVVITGGIGVSENINSGGYISGLGFKISRSTKSGVTTSFVDVCTPIGGTDIFEISWYNTSGGAAGAAIIMGRNSCEAKTDVSIIDNSTCGVSFQVSGGKLQAKTTSGTVNMNIVDFGTTGSY